VGTAHGALKKGQLFATFAAYEVRIVDERGQMGTLRGRLCPAAMLAPEQCEGVETDSAAVSEGAHGRNSRSGPSPCVVLIRPEIATASFQSPSSQPARLAAAQ